MKLKSKNYWLQPSARSVALSAVLAAAALVVPAGNAGAVSFEQKWKAGEQLSYGLNLTGTLSLNTDPTAPFILAGVPLDVEVTGTGDVSVDTRSVNPDGSGIVALKVPNLTLTGSAWEQKAVVDLKDGKPAFTFNGKATKVTDQEAKFLVEPSYGLEIAPTGRVRKIVALDPRTGAVGPEAELKVDGLPVNMQGLLRTAIMQMLPAPWPVGDVAVGDTWTVPSSLPVPAAAGTAGPAVQMLELGSFTMTLKGEETVGTRKAWRVAVEGAMTIDKAKAAIINAAAGSAAADKVAGNKITSAVQKVSGDLWFDPQAGQLVKADLILRSQYKGVFDASVMKNSRLFPNAENTPPFNSTQSFYGGVKLNLREAATP